MKKWLTAAIVTVCISVLSAMGTHWLFTPRLASFDVKSTLNAYHQELIKKDISLEVQTERLTRFATVMNEEVARYSANHKTIVLVSAAVVEGVEDITPHIQQAIIQRYQESP